MGWSCWYVEIMAEIEAAQNNYKNVVTRAKRLGNAAKKADELPQKKQKKANNWSLFV